MQTTKAVIILLAALATSQFGPRAPVDPSQGAPISEAWEVGTELIGLRTRSIGNSNLLTGTVVASSGNRLTVRMQDFFAYDCVLEHGGTGRFQIVAHEKREARGGELSNFTSKLVLRDGCLSGRYAWLVDGKKRVQGKLELRAVGAPSGSKDKVVARWSPGTVVNGHRQDAQLDGRIVRHDGKVLTIAINELFDTKGKRVAVNFVYEFQRVSGKKGRRNRSTYRLRHQEPLVGGPVAGHRFAFEGKLDLKDDTLSGRIGFKNFPRKPRSHDNEFELQISEVRR